MVELLLALALGRFALSRALGLRCRRLQLGRLALPPRVLLSGLRRRLLPRWFLLLPLQVHPIERLAPAVERRNLTLQAGDLTLGMGPRRPKVLCRLPGYALFPQRLPVDALRDPVPFKMTVCDVLPMLPEILHVLAAVKKMLAARRLARDKPALVNLPRRDEEMRVDVALLAVLRFMDCQLHDKPTPHKPLADVVLDQNPVLIERQLVRQGDVDRCRDLRALVLFEGFEAVPELGDVSRPRVHAGAPGGP